MLSASRPRPRRLVALGGLALALTLSTAACGSDDSPDAAGSAAPTSGATQETTTAPAEEPTNAPAEEAEDAPAGGDACADFDAAGGTGATVGPLQLWLPADELAAEAQSKLEPMRAVEPPTALAEGWTTVEGFYESVVQQADAGGVDVVALNTEQEGVQEHFSAITDWYFASCS